MRKPLCFSSQLLSNITILVLLNLCSPAGTGMGPSSFVVAAFITRAESHVFHLAVHAKPGARTSSICGPLLRTHEALEVRVAAPPVEGKANEELVEYLESELTHQLKQLHAGPDAFLKKTLFFSIRADAENLMKSAPLLNDAPPRKSNKERARPSKQCTSLENAALFPPLDVVTASRFCVTLVKGSAARNKTVAVEFPGGSETYLFALLEAAASS